MYTLIAVWSAPNSENGEAFEEHYDNEHAPKAATVPNLEEFITTRTAEGLEDGDPAFYRVAEVVFESLEAMHQSEESGEWAALREDASEMIERFGVTMEIGIGEHNIHDGGD